MASFPRLDVDRAHPGPLGARDRVQLRFRFGRSSPNGESAKPLFARRPVSRRRGLLWDAGLALGSSLPRPGAARGLSRDRSGRHLRVGRARSPLCGHSFAGAMARGAVRAGCIGSDSEACSRLRRSGDRPSVDRCGGRRENPSPRTDSRASSDRDLGGGFGMALRAAGILAVAARPPGWAGDRGRASPDRVLGRSGSWRVPSDRMDRGDPGREGVAMGAGAFPRHRRAPDGAPPAGRAMKRWLSLHRAAPLFLALIVVSYADPLFGPRAFGGRDLTPYNYPTESMVHDAYARGRLPVWAADVSGGRPLLPNPNAGALYPARWLLSPLPFPLAMR